jgi:phage terminase large subunit-like protein
MASTPETPETISLASRFAALHPDERRALIGGLTEQQVAALLYDWPFWARPKQLPPPGDWWVWLVLAGRGWGKTRTGAEMVRHIATSGRCPRIALVSRTAADVRDVIVEGESGLLTISPPWFRPTYEPSKRRLTWPNGVIATTFSADEPDALRGPQFFFAWADELASWRFPEAWDLLQMAVRLGEQPRIVATTTPRPTRLIRELVADPRCVVTRGTTYENAEHLSPKFLRDVVRRYEGTRLGRQELYAELLTDAPGALWTRAVLERSRQRWEQLGRQVPPLARVVVAIDPAVTAGEESAETGIIVAGTDERGDVWVLEDLSLRGTPHEWASAAVGAARAYRANSLVAEVNNGGDMVIATIHSLDPSAVVHRVVASRGKFTRAEPVAALYEQQRVHHVGYLADLEDQLCTWVPGDPSPDRLDALVWAITALVPDLDPRSKRYGRDFGIA